MRVPSRTRQKIEKALKYAIWTADGLALEGAHEWWQRHAAGYCKRRRCRRLRRCQVPLACSQSWQVHYTSGWAAKRAEPAKEKPKRKSVP
jgi:hypothetical protein